MSEPTGYNATLLLDPPWLNAGDNAWQMTAASLVGLQSIPGLAVLYAGIVKRKWAINSAFMVFYAFAATLIVWVLFAYKMGFGEQWGAAPFIGTPGPLMTTNNEIEQALLPTSGVTAQFPMATMAYFQLVFAAITIIICGGAYLARMNFLAWMIFAPLWITFSYTVVHSVFGVVVFSRLEVSSTTRVDTLFTCHRALLGLSEHIGLGRG